MPTQHLSAETFSNDSRWWFVAAQSARSPPFGDRIHGALWSSISQREHLDSRTHSFKRRKSSLLLASKSFRCDHFPNLPCYFRSNLTAAVRFDSTRAQGQRPIDGTACWFRWTSGFRINAIFFGFAIGLVSICGAGGLLIFDRRIVSRRNYFLNWFFRANGWL